MLMKIPAGTHSCRPVFALFAVTLFLSSFAGFSAAAPAGGGAEPSLRCILMGCEGQPGVGFGFDFDPDPKETGLFEVYGTTLELRLVAEFAGHAPNNRLGIYNTAGEKIILFEGEDFASSVLSLTFADDALMIGEEIIAEDFGKTFGFYLENNAIPNPFAWFSENHLNFDGLIAHFLVLPAERGSYYLGLEDLAGGGDLDYNDFVFQAQGATLLPASAIPEPSTSLLLAIGLLGLAASRRSSKL